LEVLGGELIQLGLPFFGQLETDESCVFGVGDSARQSGPFGAVDEFDCAVVSELEIVCGVGDGGTFTLAVPLDCQ
jgi:hypothetical protein